MILQDVLQTLYDSSIATGIRESDRLFPYIESVHILAVAFVFGSVAIVDLRLIGMASMDRRFIHLSDEVLRYTWVGFVGAAITGSLLFVSNALEFGRNPYFIIKMLLIAAAGLNMIILHFLTGVRRDEWEPGELPPARARLAGYLSLLLWTGVIFSGRWIGFSIDHSRFG